MPRYVVLTHDHPYLHWDFLLEYAGKLRAWRLDQPPNAGGTISATQLPDHRLHYLDYEGPVSGNRGEVRRWDRGEYVLLGEIAERLKIRLQGEQLTGVATLNFSAIDAAARFEFLPD